MNTDEFTGVIIADSQNDPEHPSIHYRRFTDENIVLIPNNAEPPPTEGQLWPRCVTTG